MKTEKCMRGLCKTCDEDLFCDGEEEKRKKKKKVSDKNENKFLQGRRSSSKV